VTLLSVGRVVAAIAGLFILGCGSAQEVIQVTAEGRRASAQAVDEDAWRLLPPGGVVWLRGDAKSLFSAEFGAKLAELLTTSLPFAKGAAIDPAKDIDLVVGALYASAGSDVVAICKGRFRKASSAAAIKASPTSVAGLPIQSTVYAGETMYVVGQVAMAVVTDSTLVFGTQLGVRRVLERVEEGRLDRNLPPWYEELLLDPAAQFQWGVDLDSQPIPATLGKQLAFLRGLRAARILGNFREPGLNFAGTLTYTTPAAASEAAQLLSQLRNDLAEHELVFAALNISEPIRRLKAQAVDKDTQVVAAVDGAAVLMLLTSGAQFFGETESGQWLPN
jgi:hypothetical protein